MRKVIAVALSLVLGHASPSWAARASEFDGMVGEFVKLQMKTGRPIVGVVEVVGEDHVLLKTEYGGREVPYTSILNVSAKLKVKKDGADSEGSARKPLSKMRLGWGLGLSVSGALAAGVGFSRVDALERRTSTGSCGPGCSVTTTRDVVVSEPRSEALGYAGIGTAITGLVLMISYTNAKRRMARHADGIQINPVVSSEGYQGLELSYAFGAIRERSPSRR